MGKITSYAENTTVAATDILPIVDDPGGSPATQKATVANVVESMLATEIATATVASRPAAAKAGRLFLPTNGYTLDRDTGAAWEQWGMLSKFTAPVSGDFSWVNQGGASIVTTNGGILIRAPHSATANLRIRVKAAPSAPYTITAYILPQILSKNYHNCGLCFRQSSDGKLATFHHTGGTLFSSKYTNETTFSADYVSTGYGSTRPQWMRIADNNTNRICSYSWDGQNWYELHSVSRTDFLTADQVGFYVNCENNATPNLEAGILLLSWLQG